MEDKTIVLFDWLSDSNAVSYGALTISPMAKLSQYVIFQVMVGKEIDEHIVNQFAAAHGILRRSANDVVAAANDALEDFKKSICDAAIEQYQDDHVHDNYKD